MGAFEYTVLTNTGRERKGVAEGDNARQVRQQLREQGLTPLAVEEVKTNRTQRNKKTGKPVSLSLQRGISATDLALITRQLATLVRSGLPLDETLQTVARQSEKPRLKSMMLAVRARVMEGHTLAAGLADYPKIFPDLFRATVAAGEQSGHLDVVLERLADYTESRQQLRQKIQLAIFYPAVLTLVAIAVTVALLTYVVPQVVQVFDNIGQKLPWLTVALITVSDFLVANGVYLLLALAALITGFSYMLKLPGMRLKMHVVLHRLPLISRLMRGLNTARFARTFSILVASGVPVLEAMRISSSVLSSLPMRAAVEDAAAKVREGASLHHTLEASGYFPPMTLQLIASGEASGNLEDMLERAAVNQERELETLIAYLMGLFEPLLILAMGGVVVVIVLAILLPIFDLNQLVQ
ncbi:MAG: type II secretion system inner membrane protein GspF [Gammaproteobacteria bacterium]|nr:type II secretion system inner membrane protein GspF [Gammaproteobacteria bacterium]